VLAHGVREPSRPWDALMEPVAWVGRWKVSGGLDEGVELRAARR
jgi:hypothetical protein